MTAILLVLLVSLLSCIGQLCQKQAVHQHRRSRLIGWLMAAIICLSLGMLVWLFVLQRMPVGVAYPMLSINFIFVAFAARMFWGERLSSRQLLGTALIVAGVAVMGCYA